MHESLRIEHLVPAYAELRCISNFTFLRGASGTEELVVRAKELGYSAMAITDECSFAGIVQAHVVAKQEGLKLLLGAQFCIQPRDASEAAFTLVVLAQNYATATCASSSPSCGAPRTKAPTIWTWAASPARSCKSAWCCCAPNARPQMLSSNR